MIDDNHPESFIYADGKRVLSAPATEWTFDDPDACRARLADAGIPWKTFTLYRQFRRPDGKLATVRVCGSTSPQPDADSERRRRKKVKDTTKHVDCKCIIPPDMAAVRGMVENRHYRVDAAGHIISIEQTPSFVIDHLLAMNIISQAQHFFATQYLRMRLSFTNGTRPRGNHFYDAPDLEAASNPDDAKILPIPIDPLDYIHVCHAITNPHHDLIIGETCIEHADCTTLNHLKRLHDEDARREIHERLHTDTIRKAGDRISAAFDTLSRVISWLWELKSDCTKAGCDKTRPCCDGSCIKPMLPKNFACATRPIVAD